MCGPDGELHITVVLGRVSSGRADYLATKIAGTLASVIDVRRDQCGEVQTAINPCLSGNGLRSD